MAKFIELTAIFTYSNQNTEQFESLGIKIPDEKVESVPLKMTVNIDNIESVYPVFDGDGIPSDEYCILETTGANVFLIDDDYKNINSILQSVSDR